MAVPNLVKPPTPLTGEASKEPKEKDHLLDVDSIIDRAIAAQFQRRPKRGPLAQLWQDACELVEQNQVVVVLVVVATVALLIFFPDILEKLTWSGPACRKVWSEEGNVWRCRPGTEIGRMH